MKRLLLFAAIVCASCSVTEKEPDAIPGGLNIIPQPVSVTRVAGEFVLAPETTLVAQDEASMKAANLLNEELLSHYGFSLSISGERGEVGAIIFSNTESDKPETNEMYRLKIVDKQIEVSGGEKGLTHAVQTLLQLLPEKSERLTIPAAIIQDAPRFKYRGMHLDVARHFMPVDFVKKYIRHIVRYKFNYFHWHLTDDQGWRIEIKQHPRLTEIGSKRSETVVGKNYSPYKGDEIPVSGFYTQEEIRDVVAYAAARNITIIPEIDVPGHTSAALAAYPELGCKENYNYKVQTTWGGFPDVMCPSESTIAFVKDILTETAELFPNSPIHIGGDEMDLTHWRESPLVQEIKKRENLATETDVHRWFTQQIVDFAAERGIKLIGWDELLDSGVDNSVTIMAWRNGDDRQRAAAAQNDIIMAPWDSVYFDHPQDDPANETYKGLGEPVTLEQAYVFDPIPKGQHDSGNIIGGQGFVWTEFLKKPEDVEYMMFPRVIALSEALWTNKAKEISEFKKRLANELTRLDRENINYRLPPPFGLINRNLGPTDRANVEIAPPLPGGRIYYTDDGSEPTMASKPYTRPFVQKIDFGQTVELKAIFVSDTNRKSPVAVAKYIRLLPQMRPANVPR